jgi:hypothetical protein
MREVVAVVLLVERKEQAVQVAVVMALQMVLELLELLTSVVAVVVGHQEVLVVQVVQALSLFLSQLLDIQA